MFEKLKIELYFAKMDIIYKKGLQDGNIVPFDDEFMEHLNNKFFNGLPVAMQMKYYKPIMPPGECYDRSFLMFCCFDDATLVQGDVKQLELRFGKDNAWHAWIERNGYVYDPSIMKRFDKDLYYKIFIPRNITKKTKDEFCSSVDSKRFYDSIASTKIEDYLPGGERRIELLTFIPPARIKANTCGNEEMKKDLNDWLTKIDYDAEQIHDERIKEMHRALKKIK